MNRNSEGDRATLTAIAGRASHDTTFFCTPAEIFPMFPGPLSTGLTTSVNTG
jgi:hypothetical protein